MSSSLAQRTIKNSLYGLISYMWPIAFAIFVTPIIIHRLGIADYGLYVLTLIVTSFFTLLNFGLVYAFVRKLASMRTGGSDEEKEELENLYGSTLFIFLLIGIVSFLASIAIAHFGLGLLRLAPEQYAVGKIIFYITGVTAFLSSLTSVYSHIPYALQRQDIGTNIYIANITLLNSAIIAVLLLGHGLVLLVALQALSAVFLLLASYWYAKKLLPSIRPKYIFKKKIFKSMFSFGGYVYLHNISSSFLSQLDRLIISGLLGPAAVALYTIPNSVSEKTQGVIVSLSGVLFPVTSELVKGGDQERIRRVYHRAMRTIALLAAAMSMTIIVLADKVLLHWIGPEVAQSSTHLIYWLAPTYFLLALFLPTTHFLTGIGKVRFMALSSVSMAVVNIVLLIILLPMYGITGAAIAYLLSLAPLIYIFYHIEHHFLHETQILKFYVPLFAKLVITSGVFAVITSFIVRPFVNNLLAVLIAGALSVAGYLALYKLLGFFEREEWILFKDFSRTILMKLKVLKA